MLGLPSHVCLWAGAVPGEEEGSREPPAAGAVGWSQDAWASKQGNGVCERGGCFKGHGQEVLGILAGLSEVG